MFNVDFPKDTSDVKFRAIQWICTEVLLALAALLNFMPRKLSRCLSLTNTHDCTSPLFPVRLLFLLDDRHAGLRSQPSLASDRHSQHLGVPDSGGGVHVDL